VCCRVWSAATAAAARHRYTSRCQDQLHFGTAGHNLLNATKQISNLPQVLVASIGSGMQAKRMELASRLWEAGIAVRRCAHVQGLGACAMLNPCLGLRHMCRRSLQCDLAWPLWLREFGQRHAIGVGRCSGRCTHGGRCSAGHTVPRVRVSHVTAADVTAHVAAGGVWLQAQPKDAGDAGDGAQQRHPLHRAVWQHGEHRGSFAHVICSGSCSYWVSCAMCSAQLSSPR
jgi:hypothetical protein